MTNGNVFSVFSRVMATIQIAMLNFPGSDWTPLGVMFYITYPLPQLENLVNQVRERLTFLQTDCIVRHIT
jgi:hypothetical protein